MAPPVASSAASYCPNPLVLLYAIALYHCAYGLTNRGVVAPTVRGELGISSMPLTRRSYDTAACPHRKPSTELVRAPLDVRGLKQAATNLAAAAFAASSSSSWASAPPWVAPLARAWRARSPSRTCGAGRAWRTGASGPPRRSHLHRRRQCRRRGAALPSPVLARRRLFRGSPAGAAPPPPPGPPPQRARACAVADGATWAVPRPPSPWPPPCGR
mmetsp:Transcript_3670/g.13185  ORF Transcript_3670/g.13185 Transcript_3670/m.13185 type:complete len:215 (-) Transcript_3670:190-834(-)